LRQYSVVPISILYEGQIAMPRGMLDKYVFLSRGKKGFASGIVREAWRRAKKLVIAMWTPKSSKPALAKPMRTTV